MYIHIQDRYIMYIMFRVYLNFLIWLLHRTNQTRLCIQKNHKLISYYLSYN